LRIFGANAIRGAKEARGFQAGGLGTPIEVVEKTKPPGAGAKSAHSRAHFRDSTSARERRFLRWKTKRKMGRFFN